MVTNRFYAVRGEYRTREEKRKDGRMEEFWKPIEKEKRKNGKRSNRKNGKSFFCFSILPFSLALGFHNSSVFLEGSVFTSGES